ncbi:MAG TPA: hypothetical protein VM286_01985 [Candidatus Thermoplasmatota archaeon]|nr:hypothetical protein [Candidatus Thermoplasmatota archaeon]
MDAPQRRPPPTPRWVWLLAGGIVVAILLFAALHLAGLSPKGH